MSKQMMWATPAKTVADIIDVGSQPSAASSQSLAAWCEFRLHSVALPMAWVQRLVDGAVDVGTVPVEVGVDKLQPVEKDANVRWV